MENYNGDDDGDDDDGVILQLAVSSKRPRPPHGHRGRPSVSAISFNVKL